MGAVSQGKGVGSAGEEEEDAVRDDTKKWGITDK